MMCPKCKGEGFLIIEDVEILSVKECPKCEGEGEIIN
jgi:DnaJ-class molecular chaperone